MSTNISAFVSRPLALAVGLAAISSPEFALAQGSGSTTKTTQETQQVEWYDPVGWYDNEDSLRERHVGSDYYDESWDDLDWWSDFDEVFNGFGVSYTWNVDDGEWQLVYGEDFEFDGSAKEVFGNEALDGPATIESREERSDDLALYDVPLADDSQKDESDERSSDATANQEKGSGNAVKTLTGTVAGFRKEEVSYSTGPDQTIALARIELDGERTAVVDLGLADLWEDTLSSGDEVTFYGASGVVNGKNVFAAAGVVANGETVFIDRALSVGGEEARANADVKTGSESKTTDPSDGRTVTIEGQVAETAKVKIGDKEQTFLKVSLQSGQSATVSLGSGRSIAELGLREGDRLRVEGELKRINGKKVIAASSVSVDGEKVKG